MKAITNKAKNALISSFIALSLKIPILTLRIVCTSKIGNLSVQVGVPPGVGSDMAFFEVLGGWPPITPVVLVNLRGVLP